MRGYVVSLPQIDPQVLMACREQSPNFGKGGGGKSLSGQPTNPSGT